MIKSEKNTLVILTPGFPDSEADTTCLPLQQCFIKNLRTLYPELNIIILSFQYPFHKKPYSWFGIPVISFDGRNKGGLARLLLRRPINNVLNKLNESNNIVGLLSFWYGECALIGHRFGGKYQLKHYCWLMGQDARKENKYPERVHANATELIALSDFLQSEFERNHGTRPQHVIPSGVDPKQFNVQSIEKDIDILGAGSLIGLKQYDQFIKIIAEIKEEILDIKAILVGDGPEKEKLLALISTFGLQDTITLTGELPHDEVLRVMQRTKVFLHTSSYEGFSGVCLEALSAGAEVISFCRPMKQDIQHWRIVKNKEAMKQELLVVLQNKDEYSTPAFPFLITDTVKAVAALFDLN